MNFLAEEWTETFPYQLLVGTGVALMALLLLAAVSFQCSSTWQWLMRVRRHMKEEDAESDLSQQNAIRISHSLPDLQSEPITHEYVQEQKDSKKVWKNCCLISAVKNITFVNVNTPCAIMRLKFWKFRSMANSMVGVCKYKYIWYFFLKVLSNWRYNFEYMT